MAHKFTVNSGNEWHNYNATVRVIYNYCINDCPCLEQSMRGMGAESCLATAPFNLRFFALITAYLRVCQIYTGARCIDQYNVN